MESDVTQAFFLAIFKVDHALKNNVFALYNEFKKLVEKFEMIRTIRHDRCTTIMRVKNEI